MYRCRFLNRVAKPVSIVMCYMDQGPVSSLVRRCMLSVI